MQRYQFQQWLLGASGGLVSSLFLSQCQSDQPAPVLESSPTPPPRPTVQLLISTFLGNDQRRFYGSGIPTGLKLQQKFLLGTGQTRVGADIRTWSGAGWTGQPTLVEDHEETYLIIGAYDHSLRKLNIKDFSQAWRVKFDDVIKGTATIYLDLQAPPENQIVIVQGSRMGFHRSLSSPVIPSLRAVSCRTGQDLWQLNIPLTASYSRDHDGSPLYLADTHQLLTVAENGLGYFLDADLSARESRQGLTQPEIIAQVQLFNNQDIQRQGGNLVTESSPARWQNHVYVAAGSGHIYGIDLIRQKIDWDFFIGTDLDGSVVISQDGKLFCTIEKEYNAGLGGVIKLSPRKSPSESVEWFLPTGNARVSSWQGGIIGSVALNDEYNPQQKRPRLWATQALDGYLYIGSQDQVTGKTVPGPRNKAQYPTPIIAVKQPHVASISTPIFTEGDGLVAAGYGGIYLYQLIYTPAEATTPQALRNATGDSFLVSLKLIDKFGPGISFEATPIVWRGKIYIAARDGYLYCLA